MMYLYHSVPKNLEGSILYPLNELKEKYPEIYSLHVAKYVGREHIMDQRILVLDCLWNDVLHFSAVNPKGVKEALIEAGRSPDFTLNYYQVDPALLEPKNAIVYLYAHTDNADKMSKENFAAYNPEDVAKFSQIPQETKDYYKETIQKGGRPLLYHRIPHILYKGALDVTNLPIISV